MQIERGMARLTAIERRVRRRWNARRRRARTALLVLLAIAVMAAVLHIAWTREERLPGKGTLSPAALAEMDR